MERVKTLIRKLQEQSESNASIRVIMQTVQMLQAELQSMECNKNTDSGRKVSVVMPVSFGSQNKNIGNPEKRTGEEKVVHTLQVDEKEIEEELEEIKRHATVLQTFSHHNALDGLDVFEEVPTLSHQDPLPAAEKVEIDERIHITETNQFYESQETRESLNDKLKVEKLELSQTLADTPIKDLRKAISVNDRFQFINELFRGDESMYERCIKTIQGFSIYPEAEYWIRRELKIKIGWRDNNPIVKHFDEMVKRRFL